MSLFDIRTFKTAKVPKNIEMNEMSFESFRNGHDEFELTVSQANFKKKNLILSFNFFLYD